MTTIVAAEDDYLQSQWLQERLEAGIEDVHVDVVQSESEFRVRLPGWEEHPPQLFILDVMMRWTDPAPDMPPPPQEVIDGGFYRAGLRCRELLEGSAMLKDVPILLFTVLDRKDIERELGEWPKPLKFLNKGDAGELLKTVRKLLA